MRGAAQRVGGRLRIMKTNVVACAIEVLDVIVVVGDAHSMRNERRWRAVGDGGGHGERGHRSPMHGRSVVPEGVVWALLLLLLLASSGRRQAPVPGDDKKNKNTI